MAAERTRPVCLLLLPVTTVIVGLRNLLEPKMLAGTTGRDLRMYSSVDTAGVVRVCQEHKQ